MAEEENQDAGETKSKKKLIIIIAAVVITAIAASVGVTLFLLSDNDTKSNDQKIEEVEEPKGPVVYFNIKPPFLVTFNVEGRQRYMQVHVTASSRVPSSLEALEHHMPLIRSKILSVYGALEFESIQTDEGKVALRAQTLSVINALLEGEGASPIENIFFTNFVLQ